MHNYLGIVLGKKSNELAPGEQKQVRTLLKDDSEGQAQSTMTAWDTILKHKSDIEAYQKLVMSIYE